LFALGRGLTDEVGMDEALRLAGLPLEGTRHRGVDDAWNIAARLLSAHR
jgi:inhibitor of KinA sporulation pathway (predicted exonuclease)